MTLFDRFKGYPERRCPVCGKLITPHFVKRPSGRYMLESIREFERRKACRGRCAKERHAQVAKASEVRRRQRAVGPVKPVAWQRSIGPETATRDECLEALKAACEFHPDLGPMLAGEGAVDIWEKHAA